MTAAGGYARLYRGILGHPALKDYAEESAFIWLILRAAWKPVRLRYLEKVVYLKRGEVAVSVRAMARGFRWSIGATQRFIQKLQVEGMVQVRQGPGFTILTICSYSIYQAAIKEDAEASHERVGGESGSESGSESPAAEGKTATGESPYESPNNPRPSQPRVTEQVIKESNKDTGPLKKRASSIPKNWKAPAIEELSPQARACALAWPVGVYDRQAEAFANYWTGEGKPKKDWTATWANWVVRVHSEIMRDVARFAPRVSAPTYRELVREGKA